MHDQNLRLENLKKIVVTGAAGTVGSELIKQLVPMIHSDCIVLGLDNNEGKLFEIDLLYFENRNVQFAYCDIRSQDDLYQHFSEAELILHTAALKHVVVCEGQPEQAIQTNINGTQNVITAAKECGVKNVIFTSSDKAVNPTNVMGTTKLMGERLITAANASSTDTKFSSVRFGNVMGSNGSVIPIFRKQIAEGGPITITDPAMTRFVMSIKEAALLILKTAEMMVGGEVFVTKMAVLKIENLADAMIQLDGKERNIQKKIIGKKPGEKLYEELVSEEECSRTLDIGDFLVITPAYRGFYKKIVYSFSDLRPQQIQKEYNSHVEDCLDVDQTKLLLKSLDHSGSADIKVSERYWPGEAK